jgi:hypothetical protein
VFLHIPKTAGTSVVHFFQQRLPAHSMCSHGDFLRFPPDPSGFRRTLEGFDFVSGHFGYRDIAPLLNEAFSFTFLRDPVDRVLSFYRFCRHPDMQRRFPVARAARDLGLEGFLLSQRPEVCEMLDNQQTWQLARGYWQADRQALAGLDGEQLLALALAHLAQFDQVGLTETFAQDFSRVLGALGIDQELPVQRQLTTSDPLRTADLPAELLQALRQRLQLDYRLIERVRAARSDAVGDP